MIQSSEVTARQKAKCKWQNARDQNRRSLDQPITRSPDRNTRSAESVGIPDQPIVGPASPDPRSPHRQMARSTGMSDPRSSLPVALDQGRLAIEDRGLEPAERQEFCRGIAGRDSSAWRSARNTSSSPRASASRGCLWKRSRTSARSSRNANSCRNLPRWRRKRKPWKCYFPHNRSRIIGLPANPDTARGYTGHIVLDEFAFHGDAHKIYAACFPIITRGYSIEVISTPNGTAGKFYEIAKQAGLVGPSHGVSRAETRHLTSGSTRITGFSVFGPATRWTSTTPVRRAAREHRPAPLGLRRRRNVAAGILLPVPLRRAELYSDRIDFHVRA